jgi:DNA-binding transcriptional ArsR family regulator
LLFIYGKRNIFTLSQISFPEKTMDERHLDEMENLFLALSDKTRLRILAMMRDREVAVGEFTDVLGESQPKVSRHLAYLRSAGLVSTRRDGKWIYYHITEPSSSGIASILHETLRCAAGIDRVGFVPHPPNDSVISDETYMTDPTQGELEIYLL